MKVNVLGKTFKVNVSALIVSIVITSTLIFVPLWYYSIYLRSQGVYIPLEMQLTMLTRLGILIGIPLALLKYFWIDKKKKKDVDEGKDNA